MQQEIYINQGLTGIKDHLRKEKLSEPLNREQI